MFTALQPLLANLASLTIALVNNTDGTITVTVTPYGGKAGNVLDTPLSLTGTAAEFDERFVEHLNSYVPKRQTLADQLAATEAILEAAQKEATDKAKKSIAKPAKTASPTTTDNPEGSDDDNEGDDDTGACCNAPASSESISTEPSAPAASTEAKGLWE